jgi:ribosomal protein S18 acetylase RimI-like enzyme
VSLFQAYAPGAPRGEPLPGLAIRPATPADAPALAAIKTERDGWPLEKNRAAFERSTATPRPDVHLLVAEASPGAVVAFGRAWLFRPPPDAPANAAPAGWYLAGVIVAGAFRRRSVGAALTAARLAWIAERAREAYYFANAQNRVSIDLHARFGFRELTRDFWLPDARFEGGVGILFRADLAAKEGDRRPT